MSVYTCPETLQTCRARCTLQSQCYLRNKPADWATDPSVSPGDGGEVRQRLFPKPGIPHFRIQWHPILQKPWYVPMNDEARKWHITMLLTSENYLYFRGGIIHRYPSSRP